MQCKEFSDYLTETLICRSHTAQLYRGTACASCMPHWSVTGNRCIKLTPMLLV